MSSIAGNIGRQIEKRAVPQLAGQVPDALPNLSGGPLGLRGKLAVLADAAKYDASCSSSGTASRNSMGGKGVGSSEGSGICHAYAPDGRCISLLKILLTNY
ncbi:MAG: biotin synthase, partial [Pseudomonadota bacterium]